MKPRFLLALAALAILAGGWIAERTPVEAGELPRTGYRALAPISSGNLTIFPVVAANTHDYDFLTLDEGIRSGEVVVTEAGNIRPLIRRGGRPVLLPPQSGSQVNRLMLVNNSRRPLLLLAGEIVTGGKQDRVIGKDRIVPAYSDPIDLGVFCVEPGRWTAVSDHFGSLGAQMAQPSVRKRAMSDKDQQMVWNEVRKSAEAAGAVVGGSASVPATTSYARVMNGDEVKQKVDEIARPIERDYEKLLRELRARNAVGVVAAVNGEIVWADIFASPALLQDYWPKLVRSYAAEAMVSRGKVRVPKTGAAQAFLDDLEGRRQVSETEPGVFRHTEIVGDGFRVFELTSLLPKTGFDVHLAKAAD
jgi:hypothetical protein